MTDTQLAPDAERPRGTPARGPDAGCTLWGVGGKNASEAPMQYRPMLFLAQTWKISTMKQPTLTHFRAMADRKKSRIQPPETLSDAQKLTWHQTVDGLPADWFATEQTPMLVLYCQHVARAAQIEVALSTLDPLASLDVYDKLAKLAALESAKICMHARAMRLTQQSRLKAETAASHGAGAASAAAVGADTYFDDLIAH